MKRRKFITLLGGAVGWPLAARAQQRDRMRRIGILVGEIKDSDSDARLAGLRVELEKLGWTEGHNVRIDTRFAGGADAQVLAKELVALQPDVILTQSTPATAAVQRVTSTIPIVFVGVADPIHSGFVTDLARPSDNLTGVLLFETSIGSKWVAMLKEIAPRLARIAILVNPKTAPFYESYLRAAEAAAFSLAIELVLSRIGSTTADIERAIESFARAPNGGLVAMPDTTNTSHRHHIIALAGRHRLPAVYSNRLFVADGGLMSYGTDRVDQFRQGATYLDRILRGAKPTDLPVQAPIKYETVINLKTAKALGLTVPDLLLVRADEVLE